LLGLSTISLVKGMLITPSEELPGGEDVVPERLLEVTVVAATAM